MIFSTDIFWTFIITSVEQLLAKDLSFRTFLGGGFIIVVAHINLIAETWLKTLGTIYLWCPQRKGVGEVLKFVACLQILMFQNRDLSFISADGGDGEGDQKMNQFLWIP